MLPNQLPITCDSDISITFAQAIIKLRTKELRKHQEQCPMLSMNHEDSTMQMTDEYNIDYLESEHLISFGRNGDDVEPQGPRGIFCIKRSTMQAHGIYGYTS
jgi:hypothetical protein